MTKTLFFTLGLLLLITGLLSAQGAQSTFNEAFSAYEAGNYEASLRKAEETEKILGGTNSRLQSLKVLNYYEKGDQKNALLELELYFNTKPDQFSSAYSDMENLRQEIKASIKQSFENSKLELEKKREDELAALTSSYTSQKDLLAFKIAQQAGTIQALELFLSGNKSENLKLEAQKLIELEQNRLRYNSLVENGLELMSRNLPTQAKESFMEAAKIKSEPWLQERIQEAKIAIASLAYSKGLEELNSKEFANSISSFKIAYENDPTPEIHRKILEAEEEFTYQQAFENKDPRQMKIYLDTYSNGRKRYLAEIFCFENYIKLTKKSLESSNYTETEKNLKELGNLNSLEHWKVYSPIYYNLVLQQAQQLTKGKKTERKSNIHLAIAHYENLDANSGKNYNGRLGYLKWKQKEWNRPDMLYVAFKTDQSLNDVGFEFGSHNNNGLGFGLDLQLSKQLLSVESSNEFELKDLDHLKGLANLKVSKKILYPLWIYAGGGYANLVGVIPNEDKTLGSTDDENQVDTVNFIGGFNIHFKPVVFTLGASYPLLNEKQNLQLGLENNPLYITMGAGIGW
ncbi:hypothetical protein E0K83_12135 [Gramella sp. BOM4]|nr:hypothetical protein [Christiangramia bathymodioli]